MVRLTGLFISITPPWRVQMTLSLSFYNPVTPLGLLIKSVRQSENIFTTYLATKNKSQPF